MSLPSESISTQNILINTAKSSEMVSPAIQAERKSRPLISTYWVNTSKQLLASGLSGCVEVCITYPTDYVKVMLQLDDGKGNQRRFKNSFDVIKQTVQNHGVFGVYRGFSIVFFGAIPKYMCRFGSYEQFKRVLSDSNGQMSSTNKLICGMGAGIFEALFAVIPQDSIKVKFINDRCSEKPKFKGLIHGISEIVKEKGIRGTYQGVTPTLLKQGLNQAIRFYIFDSLKEIQTNKTDKQSNKAFVPLFGAVAGAASVLCNTPVDVVKTRMQGLEAHRFKNTADCIVKIYKYEGLLAFYKGLVPRLVKVSLEVAIAFTMYSTLTDLLLKSKS